MLLMDSLLEVPHAVMHRLVKPWLPWHSPCQPQQAVTASFGRHHALENYLALLATLLNKDICLGTRSNEVCDK